MSVALISFLTALGLTIAGMLVNLAAWFSGGLMPLKYTAYGGELIMDTGFGLRAVYIYAMTPDGTNSRSLHFDIISFVICLLVLFAAVFLIITAVRKFRK